MRELFQSPSKRGSGLNVVAFLNSIADAMKEFQSPSKRGSGLNMAGRMRGRDRRRADSFNPLASGAVG